MTNSATDSEGPSRRPDLDRCRTVAEFLRTTRTLLSRYLEGDPTLAGVIGSPHSDQISALDPERDDAIIGQALSAVANTSLLLFAAVQQIESIAELLESDHPPVYSVTAVSRSAIELCAIAWRLVDPKIDARSRAARQWLENLYSAREFAKVPTDVELTVEQTSHIGTVETLRVQIEAAGLEVSVDGRSVGAERRLLTTELMDEFTGHDIESSSVAIYRLMSAITHGTMWGLTIFFHPGALNDDGGLSTEFVVDQGWIDGPACQASLAYSWAIENVVELLGWDPGPLELWKSSITELFPAFSTE